MKAKILWLLLLSALWINGCKEPYHMEVDANGKIVAKYQYQDSIQRKHGEYIKYYEMVRSSNVPDTKMENWMVRAIYFSTMGIFRR